MKIKGSCCCGAVRFVIDGAPGMMGTCHCSRCCKLRISTIVFVKRAQFTLESGDAHIETVQPRPAYNYARSFCRNCGTALGEPLSPEDSFPINAHCLDDKLGIANAFHEFVSEEPARVHIAHGTREFEGHPEP